MLAKWVERSSLLLILVLAFSFIATACSSHVHSAVDNEASPTQIVNGKLATSADIGVSSTVGIILTDDLKLDANGQITGFGTHMVGCTGVLIAPDTVLTAAHCEQPQLKYQFIIFSRDIVNWTQDQVRQVWQAAQDPSWAQAQNGTIASTQGIDLAVMHFQGNVPNGFAPVPIYEGQPLAIGTPVVLYGYGVTDFNAPSTAGALRSTVLQMINPPVETQTINVAGTPLTDTVPSTLRPDQFNLPSTQSGVCLGDSGGPVYDLIPGGQALLVGITSGGFGSTAMNSNFAQCHTYSTHTYVYPHEQWIASTVMQMRNDKNFAALDNSDSRAR